MPVGVIEKDIVLFAIPKKGRTSDRGDMRNLRQGGQFKVKKMGSWDPASIELMKVARKIQELDTVELAGG